MVLLDGIEGESEAAPVPVPAPASPRGRGVLAPEPRSGEEGSVSELSDMAGGKEGSEGRVLGEGLRVDIVVDVAVRRRRESGD